MSDPSNSGPAFREKATRTFKKLSRILVGFVIIAAVIGTFTGLLIGRKVDGLGWALGGCIGLAIGMVGSAILALVIWFPATLLYAMTQDGA